MKIVIFLSVLAFAFLFQLNAQDQKDYWDVVIECSNLTKSNPADCDVCPKYCDFMDKFNNATFKEYTGSYETCDIVVNQTDDAVWDIRSAFYDMFFLQTEECRDKKKQTTEDNFKTCMDGLRDNMTQHISSEIEGKIQSYANELAKNSTC